MRSILILTVLLGAIVLFAIVLMGFAFADVPHLISYQGRLTDGSEFPLTGSYNITFRLYDTPSGGTTLWAETQNVTLNSDGLYNVMLGSVMPFPSTLDFSEQYWLGVSVDGGAEICRYELGASPYALNIADTIRKAATQVLSGATGTALQIDSPGGIGAYIYHPNDDGVRILLPSDDGIAIAGGSGTKRGMYIYDISGADDPDTGIVIRKTQDVGIFIDSVNSSSGDGIRIERVGDNGVQVTSAGNNGVDIDSPGYDGVDIISPSVDGVFISSSGYNGVEITSPGVDGVVIDSPGDDGVSIYGGSSTKRGMYISDYYGAGDPDTGIVIRKTQDVGIFIDSVNSSSGDGIRIKRVGDDGVQIDSPRGDGVRINSPRYDGVSIGSPGDDGVEIAGAAGTGRGIYIHDLIGVGDPDTGIVIRKVQDFGILIDSTVSLFGDGIRIRKPGDDGVQIEYAGDNGVDIYSPGNDGVAVNTPAGDCFVCNGTPHLFRVSNTCEVYSHSYYRYIVDDEGVGYTAPIVSSTEQWLEHIGEGKIVDGQCRIDLPKDFLESVTIDEQNPVEISITPYAPIGNYWVERQQNKFIVHSDSDGQFMYKVHAKIRGFENAEIEPVDLSDYNENDENN